MFQRLSNAGLYDCFKGPPIWNEAEVGVMGCHEITDEPTLNRAIWLVDARRRPHYRAAFRAAATCVTRAP